MNDLFCIDHTGRKKKVHLSGMTQKTSNNNNEFLISFFLPEGMIDRFEVVSAKEEPNTGITKADVLYNSI